ncbi:hypothetical protein BGZ76_006953 [Entomortierella beljakovae]|nr:hypothetical protein BGZ76_006953 [Entomortierella beljakovae]
MKNIGSQAELNSQLSSAGSRLVVVDFFATWCGPCKTLAPVLDKLEQNHTSTIFAKVDVDQAQDCAKQYSVTSMPTILFFKNRSEVGRVIGADVNKIQSLIKTHEGGTSFSGSGQTLGGGSSSNHSHRSSSSTSGRNNGQVDTAPYYLKLWTALSHLSTGILGFCASFLRSVSVVAGSAKTGLIGDNTTKEYTTIEGPGGSCQIQVRLLDGSSIRGDFEPDHTLQTVRDFVQANLKARGVKVPGFTLMTNFPKIVYKDEGLQQTLEEAKLIPRAQLIVLAK